MSDGLTDERLDEIRARCEAATPGPWVWREDTGLRVYMELMFPGGTVIEEYLWSDVGYQGMDISQADAAFIAAARTAVPALLAEVERLRAALRAIDALDPDTFEFDEYRTFAEREAHGFDVAQTIALDALKDRADA